MTKVFVDAAAWIALLNTSDSLHNEAQQVLANLQKRKGYLITTEFVLVEVADALSSPLMRMQTIAFVNNLRTLPILTIIPPNQELVDQGWALYAQRSDKEWGLTDCISFTVMLQEQIHEAFTSDHHFVQAGFNKLMAH